VCLTLTLHSALSLAGGPSVAPDSDLCNDVSVSDTVLQRRRLVVTYGSGAEPALLAAWLMVVSNSPAESCALHTDSSSVYYASLTADGTAMSEGLDVRDGRLIGAAGSFTEDDLAAFEASSPAQQRSILESLQARLESSVEEYLIASCCSLFALPIGKFLERAGGGSGKVLSRHQAILTAAECCLCCIRDHHQCVVPSCEDCERDRRLCGTCTAAGMTHWHRDGRACDRCRADSHRCVRAGVLVMSTDQLSDNQTAFDRLEQRRSHVPRPVGCIFGKVHFVKNLRGTTPMPSESPLCCAAAHALTSFSARVPSRVQVILPTTGSRRAGGGCALCKWRSCVATPAPSGVVCKRC
jgi:hypothetical protein